MGEKGGGGEIGVQEQEVTWNEWDLTDMSTSSFAVIWLDDLSVFAFFWLSQLLEVLQLLSIERLILSVCFHCQRGGRSDDLADAGRHKKSERTWRRKSHHWIFCHEGNTAKTAINYLGDIFSFLIMQTIFVRIRLFPVKYLSFCGLS